MVKTAGLVIFPQVMVGLCHGECRTVSKHHKGPIDGVPGKEKKPRMKKILVICLPLFIAACAAPQTKSPDVSSVAAEIEAKKQRELALESWIEAERRLYRVAYPILASGASLCKEKVRSSIGLIAWNNHHFNKQWHEALKEKYGIGDLLQIAYVIPDSPADMAGLEAGDIPLSLNSWHVPVGDKAESEFSKKLADLLKKETDISMTVRRGDQELELSILPGTSCDYSLALKKDETKNAYADGKRIVMHTGLMNFFKTDEEIALVVSHELAHNAMGHIDAKTQNAVVGGIAGFLVDIAAAYYGVNTQGQFTDLGMKTGATNYSVEFEQEADYVGLYFMTLAGYEIDGVANFWRRMAIQNSNSIDIRSSHPTTPERFIAIEKTVEEIKKKVVAGIALTPEYKDEGAGAVSEEPVGGFEDL